MSRLNDIEKLRGWCHKVLPLVYDDSLSYYEVLCKVRAKINEVIDLTAEQNDVIEEAVQEITDWETTTDEKYNEFVAQMDSNFDTFKSQINSEVDTFEGNVTQAITTFESTVNGTVTAYKNEIDASELQYKNQMQALYDAIPFFDQGKIETVNQQDGQGKGDEDTLVEGSHCHIIYHLADKGKCREDQNVPSTVFRVACPLGKHKGK